MIELLSKKELAYQHVHFVWSMLSCYAAYLLGFKYFFVAGLVVGVVLELVQYYYNGESLKLTDRFIDLAFWTLGCVVSKYMFVGA